MSPQEHEQLLNEHHQTTLTLAHNLRHEGWLRAEERKVKSAAWNNPQHSSLSDRARDNLANHAALDHTSELFNLEGEIKAQQLELENIRVRLAYDPVALPSEVMSTESE